MIPSTVERVQVNTRNEINERIQQETKARVSQLRNAPKEVIRARLKELENEWDIERAIETNASSVILISMALGRFVNKKFYVVPAIVGGFLLQHGIQGWCPPVPLLRRLGFRTSYEIDEERYQLKAFLGESVARVA
jgi:hypothetical protein